MTIHAHLQPGPTQDGQPWRAELLASLSPRELTAAFRGNIQPTGCNATMVSAAPSAPLPSAA